MPELIYCEFLKLKHSRMLGISMLGVMVTPVMMLAEALQTHAQHPEVSVTLADMFHNSLLYTMLLINMMIFAVLSAYLFSREYAEESLKTILPIPVSRSLFLLAKFIVLYVWTAVLTGITWAGIFLLSGLYHLIIGMDGFSFGVAGKWFLLFETGNILLSAVLSPFAFLAEKTKGLMVPMIAASVVMMGNAALSNQNMGALYPWTAVYFWVGGKLEQTGYPVWLSAVLILAVSLTGFAAAVIYFEQEDVN